MLKIFLMMTALFFTADSAFLTAFAGERTVTVQITPDSNIRRIAEKYLDDPNLWIDILRANGLHSPHQLKPGMTIIIPAGRLSTALKALEKAENKIRSATQAGANLFTPDLISRAIRLKDTAVLKRKEGDLNACISAAVQASGLAGKSFQICQEKQDSPAEAIVNYFQGDVHKRPPSENVWKNVVQNDILVEGETIRTLSRSSADVLFRDNSRLSLKENSQALIRKMRVNLLDETDEANVSLIEGDVLALLAASAKGKGVAVDIEGVETRIKSNNFFVSQDKKASRFANYEGEIEIESAGVKVVLKENQGSVVPRNEKPSAPANLLPPPRILEPENGKEFYNKSFRLIWEKVPEAVKYRCDISINASFSKSVWSETTSETGVPFPGELQAGSYFWRVQAVSGQELPGRMGKARYFRIIPDDTPPYLVVRTPEMGAISDSGRIEVAGTAEKDAAVKINGRTVETGVNGEFSAAVEIPEGDSDIVVQAADKAGNESRVVRNVTCIPKSDVLLSFSPDIYQKSPGRMVAGTGREGPLMFDLRGTTEPLAAISAKSGQTEFTSSAVADETGQFQINLKLKKPGVQYKLDIRSRTGKTRLAEIYVEIDDKPPEIVFDSPPPPAVAESPLKTAGRIEDGVSFMINGEKAGLENGRFSAEIPLNPGNNIVVFESSDRAGNTVLIEKGVVLDRDPPRLTGYAISPESVKGGEAIRITVRAEDATGMVKAAPYRIKVGQQTFFGHLTLSSRENEYSGVFQVPETAEGDVSLQSTTLSDYLGNRREYAVNSDIP